MGGRHGWTVARRIVQVAMLCLFAVPLIAAGWGIAGQYAGGEEPQTTPADLPVWGSLSSSHLAGIDLLDPYAALQVAAAAKDVAFTGLLWAVPVLVVYGVVRGRAFCGWVCPVNLLLEGVDWLRAKLGIAGKEAPVPRHAKIGVAAAVLLLSALTSIPLFEALSPVGAFTRALLFGSFLGVWTLIAIVIAELFWARRVWCRALCPLGGFYQAVGVVGLLSVKIDHEACVACDRCKARCLCAPEILEPALAGRENRVAAGDCMLCGRCVEACPTHALSIGCALPKNPRL